MTATTTGLVPDRGKGSWLWNRVIAFLLSIPILRGRWRPSAARRDEQEHNAMVDAELAKLNA